MTQLTVTTPGQITFRKDILRHLEIAPGETLELDKLPDGRVTLRAARSTGTVDGFLGLVARGTTRVASLHEISEAAQAPWAGDK